MVRPDRIEGLAIVSADGMIADKTGIQPDSMRFEADRKYLHSILDKATAIAQGRNSGEGGPHFAQRRRLILTRRIARLAPDPRIENAVLWNPAGATFEQAWDQLGLSGGTLAVIGGTDVYGLFLTLGYDAFHLSMASRVRLPGGRPLFPGIPPSTPEELLSQHGLRLAPIKMLDASVGLALTLWLRP
jgi:dihydrofolate reductase